MFNSDRSVAVNSKSDANLNSLIITVVDDIDLIRAYWNDFIYYLTVERRLIIKLAHLYMLDYSPFYEPNIKPHSIPKEFTEPSEFALPLSKNAANLQDVEFISLVGVISKLSQHCQTVIQYMKSKYDARYYKIAIEKPQCLLQWLVLRHNLFWYDAFRNARDEKYKYMSKLLCYLCKYDIAFSHQMFELLLCLFHASCHCPSLWNFMRDLINIDDELQLNRFKCLFNCESNPSPDMTKSRKELFEQYGRSIDLLTIINSFKDIRPCAEFVKFVIKDMMKGNVKFRKFINELRNKDNSRWGVNLDTMIKVMYPQFYDEMKQTDPQIIRWKV